MSQNIFSQEEIMEISQRVAESSAESDEIVVADSNEVVNYCQPIFNMGNITLNLNTSNTTFSHVELMSIVEAVSECAEEFSQNFNVTSQDDASPVLTGTPQREEKENEKESKRKRNDENSEESDNLSSLKKKVKKSEEDEVLRCTICMEFFIKAVTLNCSHSFCNYCIGRWRTNRSHCPICRTNINSACPTLVIDNLIETKFDNCTDEVKELRNKIIEERSAEEPMVVTDSQVLNEEEDNQHTEEDDQHTEEDDLDTDEDVDVIEDEEYEQNYFYMGEYDDYIAYEDDDLTPFHRSNHLYYGGYGRCYHCNQRGHWAPQCPRRLRRY